MIYILSKLTYTNSNTYKYNLIKMTDGYVYCLSNPSMSGILKIGMTERTPEVRIKELFTTGVASPFKIEFAKKVSNPKQKETTLHKLLEQYTERTDSRREFFRVTSAEVRIFFDLMDGEMWVDNNEKKEDHLVDDDNVDEDEDEDEDEDKDDDDGIIKNINKYRIPEPPRPKIFRCRDMTKCFTSGQHIKHTIGITKTWVGIYDSIKQGIVYDGILYKSLNQFVVSHYKRERPDRVPNANAWSECQCEMNGEYISTYNLNIIN